MTSRPLPTLYEIMKVLGGEKASKGVLSWFIENNPPDWYNYLPPQLAHRQAVGEQLNPLVVEQMKQVAADAETLRLFAPTSLEAEEEDADVSLQSWADEVPIEMLPSVVRTTGYFGEKPQHPTIQKATDKEVSQATLPVREALEHLSKMKLIAVGPLPNVDTTVPPMKGMAVAFANLMRALSQALDIRLPVVQKAYGRIKFDLRKKIARVTTYAAYPPKREDLIVTPGDILNAPKGSRIYVTFGVTLKSWDGLEEKHQAEIVRNYDKILNKKGVNAEMNETYRDFAYRIRGHGFGYTEALVLTKYFKEAKMLPVKWKMAGYSPKDFATWSYSTWKGVRDSQLPRVKRPRPPPQVFEPKPTPKEKAEAREAKHRLVPVAEEGEAVEEPSIKDKEKLSVEPEVSLQTFPVAKKKKRRRPQPMPMHFGQPTVEIPLEMEKGESVIVVDKERVTSERELRLKEEAKTPAGLPVGPGKLVGKKRRGPVQPETT
jgi:hypothetical protein